MIATTITGVLIVVNLVVADLPKSSLIEKCLYGVDSLRVEKLRKGKDSKFVRVFVNLSAYLAPPVRHWSQSPEADLIYRIVCTDYASPEALLGNALSRVKEQRDLEFDQGRMMESFKIVVTCIIAAVLYGIVHDQFTARICLEYFTIFHPPIFHTQSPTLLGIGWGIVATWWVGAFFSVPLTLAARVGSRPLLQASELRRPIFILLVFMAGSAIMFGTIGYVLARMDVLSTDWLTFSASRSSRWRFMADWWAHNASYASAFIGGIALCVMTYRRRLRIRN